MGHQSRCVEGQLVWVEQLLTPQHQSAGRGLASAITFTKKSPRPCGHLWAMTEKLWGVGLEKNWGPDRLAASPEAFSIFLHTKLSVQ